MYGKVLTPFLLKSQEFHDELIHNILPFWMDHMLDMENGGFYGQVDGNNRLNHKAGKGVILNTRILWTFSAAYAYNADKRYLATAQRAYAYIKDHFIDKLYGGVYWMLDCETHPINTKKQVYAQAFAIYAFSEYYKITGQKEALDLGIELFHHIENFSFDQEHNGYLEAFDREWRVLSDFRLSDKDENEAKTMNTHLHILEAYTNLFRIWPDPVLEHRLKGLIRLFIDQFINNRYHFNLFFDEKWQLKSNTISYGHDVEGSWLLSEAAAVLNDSVLLKEVEHLAVKMVEASLEGIDEDGALMNEAGDEGFTDTDKHWWPQAEALVGLINAWQISKDEKYLRHAEKNWRFIKDHIIDHENGEWFWRVTKTHGSVTTEDKAGPWKCPYHNGRAMIELATRLSKHRL
ncbi:N-acyl-D-glucosamine 2-epimerase [Fulvivirga sp. M361]|uniref:AGE family epimerase/isomerase n=1 Tax=Fulvivirga sp. M361 TaxID=2594266 RepID=UPI00117A48A3|nr:AGE family epimerase/isomerase [Fulvivirga sp. M361]TRX48796.1 N-acyl-D-glucosamine 2-epimerase [Fulvivirga sp. M361]